MPRRTPTGRGLSGRGAQRRRGGRAMRGMAALHLCLMFAQVAVAMAVPSGPYLQNNETVKAREGFIEDVQNGAILISVPVVAMLLGSVIALWKTPTDYIRMIFSSGAAGILLGAVAFELFDKMHGIWWAGPTGFMGGVLFFMGMGAVLPDGLGEEDEDDNGSMDINADDQKGMSESSPLLGSTSPTNGRPPPPPYSIEVCNGENCINSGSDELIPEIEDLARDLSGTKVSRSHKCMGKCSSAPNVSVRRLDESTWTGSSRMNFGYVNQESARGIVASLTHTVPESTANTPLPWVRIAVVCVDAFMDGITVGIAVSIGFKEAAIIAVGMALEMCFVGVSLSSALMKYPHSMSVKMFIACFIPMFLYIGWLIGVYALYGVDQESAGFIAVIAFAAVALLYLAFVELLPEAHELADESSGKYAKETITLAFFIGITVVLLLENLMPEETDAERNGPL